MRIALRCGRALQPIDQREDETDLKRGPLFFNEAPFFRIIFPDMIYIKALTKDLTKDCDELCQNSIEYYCRSFVHRITHLHTNITTFIVHRSCIRNCVNNNPSHVAILHF